MSKNLRMIDKSNKGKKARASGARFELKVRKDLESKGWIVDKWGNNVEFDESYEIVKLGKLIKAKPKFVYNPVIKRRIPIGMSSGFPDFICFKPTNDYRGTHKQLYEVIGVESKMDGILDKQEKEKCKWLLKNNIFSKILITSKGKKRGEIIYAETGIKWRKSLE